jgi:large subunit ribosomal protein L29
VSEKPLSTDEIRAMSSDERAKLLHDLRMELARLRSQARMGILTNVRRIKIVKKNIARVLTVINEEMKKGA